jgi:uncharacterized phage infection (PIP) family protein YhgE
MTTPQIPKDNIESLTEEGLKIKLVEGGLPEKQAADVVENIVGANITDPRIKAINDRMVEIKNAQEKNRKSIQWHQQAIEQLVMEIAVQEGGLKDCAYWLEQERNSTEETTSKKDEVTNG